MKIDTFNYKDGSGWSLKDFPKLDSKNTLILTFYAPQFNKKTELFQLLQKEYPISQLVGCSTSGEIYNDEVNDKSISVAVVKFEHSKIKVATNNITDNGQSYGAGISLAKELNDPSLKAVLILSDGLTVNGTQLVEGIKTVLPNNVIVTGGLAGDGKDFKKTSVLKSGVPTAQCISAIGFYGDPIEITYGSKGGWDVFGPERLITRSKDNILYEIDGEPALALYKKYLGERSSGLPATGLLFPLAISESLSGTQVVRTILAVNEKDQSMTFAGNIPQGWYGQLMQANFDRLIQGSSDAGKAAMENQHSDNDRLAIAISCVGRRLVLGERSEEEIEATLDSLGHKSHLIGFYSYGEISPSGLSGCDLHNQTMTLTTITERK